MATRIGFLIFPGFPMACLTSVIEPLRAANEISSSAAFEWRLIAETGDQVTSSAGIGFEPDADISQIQDLHYIILLSAPSVTFRDPRTVSHLRRAARHGVTMGAISGGVFPLVQSGVAHNARLSVHWCYEAAFAVAHPQIERSDDVIEWSPGCVTASGAAAAFELALTLIETALGAGVAQEVACWFQHPMMRKDGVKQTLPRPDRNTADPQQSPLVARAVDLFARDLAAPVPVAQIAAQLNITPRHLERCFKQSTGMNPSRYFRKLRMQAARQIVLYTNDSMSDVAASVGYASAAPFTKHYRDAFDLSPQEDRKRINLYRVQGNLPVPSV